MNHTQYTNSNIQRRKPVLDNMYGLIKEGKDCFSCDGKCCTFAYNSMQVTPIEALDAYYYLQNKDLISEELINRLKACIKEYRLDHEIMMGRGRELRRHYTCPFFNTGPKGCSISPESKPYGCLAFNPLEKSVSVEGKCTSYLSTLEKRESEYLTEDTLNQKLKSELNLYWEKKNFPVALLNLIELLK